MFSIDEAPRLIRSLAGMIHHNIWEDLHPVGCMICYLGRVANVLGILGRLERVASISMISKVYHADAGTPIDEPLLDLVANVLAF